MGSYPVGLRACVEVSGAWTPFLHHGGVRNRWNQSQIVTIVGTNQITQYMYRNRLPLFR